MTSFNCNRRFSRVVLGTTIGMAMVIGCAGSFAQAADGDDELLDVKIFRNIMKGLGLRKDEPTGIEYRERSPLVLPAGKELPRPEADAAAKKAAGWPDDADLKRVRTRREAERKRKGFEEGVDDRPLLPNQYGTNAPPANGNKAGEAPGKSAEVSAAPSTNAELGSKSLTTLFGSLWAPKEEYVPFTGEPARSSLIEPPRGYRTPSPSQPYGVGKEIRAPQAVDKHEMVR